MDSQYDLTRNLIGADLGDQSVQAKPIAKKKKKKKVKKSDVDSEADLIQKEVTAINLSFE